ncbi:MAG: hypothetical protein HY707_03935 [Ignavibacteriae bacterium]|nr:hypothetical protein [Ignavibacteriota bacterium]
MAYTLKKTAVIGLGGTGMHAILYMKKKLLETYGEVPPMIKFLAIDTADSEQLQTAASEIRLEQGEFLKLEVKNPASLMKTPEVKKWIPDNIPSFALTSGAKAVRGLGRLAVFANSNDLEARIDGLINDIRDYTIERDEKYEVIGKGNIIINLVCSLSGGTGAGCYLDVSVLAKKNLQSTDKLIGYFLLPDIFVGKPATRNVEPNAYGALKEISYFFSTESKQSPYVYPLGGRERKIGDEGLFTAVYLINNTNRQGTKYNDISDLHEFLGIGMFLQSSSTGKKAGDIIDNLESQILGVNWYDRPTVFSSFGISEITYTGDWYGDFDAKRIALSVLQRTFTGGDTSRAGEFTDDFVRRIGIKEHEADDVINAILQAGDFKKFSLPPELKKGVISPMFGKRESYLNDIHRSLLETAKKNVAKLKSEREKALSQELTARLSEVHGLLFSKSFLNSLIGRVTEFKREMTEERDQKAKAREDLKPRYDIVKADAEKAAKTLFGTAAKIEVELKKFKELIEKEANMILEIERRERAIEFFAFFADLAQKWTERLNTLNGYCDILTQEFNQEIQAMEHEKRDVKPFVQEIKPSNLTGDSLSIEAGDFLKWLDAVEHESVAHLAEMRIDQVKTLLLKYAYSQPKVKEIKEKRLEDILKEMSTEERMKYVGLLDKMASPLWQYDRGLISGDKKTENIYLFGVENHNDTVFEPQKIRAYLASPFDPAIISTGDPKRVICLKLEAPLPAFVVSNMPRYREKYMDPRKPFSYHLHRDWEQQLPDLFAGSDEAESRKFWSLGLAEPYNLITKTGEYYYIISQKKGERTKGYKIKLGQGRGESMKAFMDNSELIMETKETIIEITDKLGTAKVIECLKSYGLALEQKSSKGTPDDIRKQIELELNDIESFIESLSSL